MPQAMPPAWSPDPQSEGGIKMHTSYNGRVLIVDLSLNRCHVDILPDEYLRLYLGGRGAAAKMLWDLTGPKTKPLGKDNVIIFSPGVLSGTNAPTSGRSTVTFKSPTTGGYFKSNVGGEFGIGLKQAGYDHIVIKGRARTPVYLTISPTKVEIIDARDIWGMGIRDTNRAIKQKQGEDELQIACIGQAGEGLSYFASIMCNYYNAAARGGGGAVMGAKNLKAIAIDGEAGKVYVTDPEKFMEVVHQGQDASLADNHSKTMKRFGTAATTDQMCKGGLLPTYNFKRQWLPSGEGNLTGQHLIDKGYLKRSVGCGTCIFGCHRYTEMDSGKFKGSYSEGPEYESFAALGANLGITDSEYILRANELANDYGFDVISLGAVASFAIESFEKGVIGTTDTEGHVLKWEDGDTLLFLIDMIVNKRGLGDLLSKGVKVASDKFGKNSYQWAVQARGLEQSRVELRGAFSYALAFALNPRGPDHLTTECLAEFGEGFSNKASDVIEKITGSKEFGKPYIEEKRAEIVTWHEDIYAVTDALGFCAFATTAAYGIDETLCARFLESATGVSLSADEIRKAGRRIVTLERGYNIREGWSSRCDVLPWRVMNETAIDLAHKQPTAAHMHSDRLGRLLKEYYLLNGWDVSNGFPSPRTLHNLGLDFLESVLAPLRSGALKAELPESCRTPADGLEVRA